MIRRRPVLVILALAAALQAQTPAPGAVNVGPVAVTANLRTRLETWRWFEGDADSVYAYPGTILRLGLGQQHARWEWQTEAALPVLLGLPANAIGPGVQGQLGLGATYFAANNRSRNAAMLFPRQAFLRFKSLAGNEAQSLRLGRFEFVEGAETAPKNITLAALKRDRIGHRLIGSFVWSHVGRSLDGLHYVFHTTTTNLTFVGARPTRGVFQTDGWGELDAAVGYLAVTRQASYGKRHNAEWRVFGLQYHDWRNVLKTDNRPLAARSADRSNLRIATLGGHYLHSLDTSAGTFDALFWGALQTGRWGVLRHRAGAASIEGGCQPALLGRLKPWIRAGYFYGSGDNDPADARHRTFFQVLPTPRWYARFPFYNLMNNRDLFGTLVLRPHRSVSMRTEFHSLRLAESGDLWYLGGGAFQPWTFGYTGRPSGGDRGLASLWASSLDYQASAHTSLVFYFANAQGKLVPAAIYPRGRNARFGYVEVNYRF
jgi:hypothetical protein